ncbi:unnamed protein product, partial [Medioppia subpectinata]
MIEIIKGQTPEDIREKCHHLCQQYLGGVWSDVRINDVNVRRISGGFSNQLYHCQLSDSVGVGADNEPRDVAVRLFGEKNLNTEFAGAGRHTDAIVGPLMAKHGLGPKIYGSFPSGEIQQFVKAYEKFPIDRLIDELNLDVLNTESLNRELQWLYKCMDETDSPVCFVHNDFRGNNIMVLDDTDHNSNTRTGQRVMFCDFECSGFGYRGTDLGTIFAEWNRDGFNDYKTVQQFPDDIHIKPFIDEYMAESIRLRGQAFSGDPRNTFTHIMTEIKVFTLVSNLFMIAISLAMDESPDVPLYTKRNLT